VSNTLNETRACLLDGGAEIRFPGLESTMWEAQAVNPVVTTAHGAVRGAQTDFGVSVFKGIPYAAAPFGADRFKPPRPAASWPGERDALEFGPTAPKPGYPPPFDELLPEVDIPGADCLNLNIWTPAPSGSAPVLVWLHGGAFANGSGSAPGYDGTRFARDGVVLVTINYRLGLEGFLYLGEGAANLGLLDQLAALAWVRENIAGFGGDPARVTVAGQSAGAMSIGALLAMPASAGLFHQAILQSGAAHHTLPAETAAMVSRHTAEKLGIEPRPELFAKAAIEELLSAFQAVRADVLHNPDPAAWREVAVNSMPYEPVVDGVTLPDDPARSAAGASAGIRLLIGSNTDEQRFFTVPTGVAELADEAALRRSAARYGLDPDSAPDVYRSGRPDSGPGYLMAALVTDWFYRIPAIRLAEARAALGAAPSHLYEFAWQPSSFGGRIGACHAAEVPFVFDNLARGSLSKLLGDMPQRVADTMHGAWVSFVAQGDPGWPAYDPKQRTTMRFDLESGAVADPRPAERELWSGVR
jgi:para-nitrobenzyl esterase